jgi:hypothetical protein
MAAAQTDENQQRQRDIKIAEGILAEIFDSRENQYGVLAGFQDRNVRGEYISGYGVHFTVSSGSNFVHIRNFSSNEEQIRVEVQNGNSSDENSEDMDEIREKMNEYMTKYASLISGLSDDETVRVTYASSRNESFRWVIIADDDRTVETEPGLSVWAKVSDLNAFKNGRISEQELMNRINSHELDGEETYKDFNVFASVLETALNSTGNKNLRVNRKPQMEYLPGLGVRYKVQVSARPSIILEELRFGDLDFQIKMDSLQMNLDKSLRLVEESLNPLIIKLDSMVDLDLSEEELDRIKQNLHEHRQEIRIHHDSLQNTQNNYSYAWRSTSDEDIDLESEADAIMDELLSVIANYGSTLTSLDDDEMLMISVNWSSRSENLPERTEIRIKKSDLLSGDDPDIEDIERR